MHIDTSQGYVRGSSDAQNVVAWIAVTSVTVMLLKVTSEFHVMVKGTLKVDEPVMAARAPEDPFQPPLSVSV